MLILLVITIFTTEQSLQIPYLLIGMEKAQKRHILNVSLKKIN